MVSKGYILLLHKFPNWDVALEISTTNVLREFIEKSETSVYQIFKNLEFPIAYKNVHKKVKRLQFLGLIEESEKKMKHGAIYYRLTRFGIFYTVLRGLWLPRELLSTSINAHRKDDLFQELLFPYFEKDSLLRLKSFFVTSAIISYLEECCASLVTRLKSIYATSKFEKLKIPIFDWNKISEVRNQKRLLRYLKNRFDLDWININETGLSITNNNTRIEIKEKNNKLYINLNQETNKATAVENGKVLFQYNLSLSKSDPTIIKIIDPQYYIPESTVSDQIEAINMDMHEILGRLFFSIVISYGWFIEEWHRDTEEIKRNDITILSQDKKFMKALNDIGSQFDRFQKEFTNLALGSD